MILEFLFNPRQSLLFKLGDLTVRTDNVMVSSSLSKMPLVQLETELLLMRLDLLLAELVQVMELGFRLTTNESGIALAVPLPAFRLHPTTE